MERFEVSHNPEGRIFTLDDKEEQVIIVLNTPQLEQLIKCYCEVYGHVIM
jgi:hypothetical protein